MEKALWSQIETFKQNYRVLEVEEILAINSFHRVKVPGVHQESKAYYPKEPGQEASCLSLGSPKEQRLR